MKKYLSAVSALIIALTAFTSCLSDPDETDYSDYYECAIKSFSISDISTTKHTTSSKGADSTYTVTLTGSNYDFAVDQMKKLIYNVDSLPLGTDVSRVLTTVSASGIATYLKDSLYMTHSSSDSIDFTSPVKFRVYSYNGKAYQDYDVRINVKQTSGDSIRWTKVNSNLVGIQLMEQKAFLLGDEFVILGKFANGPAVMTKSKDGVNWTAPQSVHMPKVGNYNSAAVFGDKLYLLSSGELYSSADALNYEAVATNVTLDRIIASSDKEICAISGGKFATSTDGVNWSVSTDESEDMSLLPTENCSYVSFPLRTNPNMSKIILLGNRANAADTCAIVWQKVSGNDWFSMAPAVGNTYRCPRMNNLAMVRVGTKLFAFGRGGTYQGKTLGDFDCIYVSVDEGITWKPNTKYAFPEGMKAEDVGYFSTLVKDGTIWVFFSGNVGVWKASLAGIQ